MARESMKELKKQEKQLEKKQRALELKKQKLLVKGGEAFFCKACNSFNRIQGDPSNYEKQSLCWSCFRKKNIEIERKMMVTKIIGSVVTDVEIDPWGKMRGMVLYHAGKALTIGLHSDEDHEPYMRIEQEEKAEAPERGRLARPGEKELPGCQTSVEKFIEKNID